MTSLKQQARDYATEHGVSYQKALFIVTEPAYRILPMQLGPAHWSVAESKETVLEALRESNWLREQSFTIVDGFHLDAVQLERIIEQRSTDLHEAGHLRDMHELRRMQRQYGIPETPFLLCVLDQSDIRLAERIARVGRTFGLMLIYCREMVKEDPTAVGKSYRSDLYHNVTEHSFAKIMDKINGHTE